MEDENNTAPLDALNEGEGDGSSEDIKSQLAKANELAENYRIRAEKAEQKAKGKEPKGDTDLESFKKEALEQVKQEFEQRDLDELEYSDEVKEQIKRISRLEGTSVRKAAQDPYIKHLVEREEQTRKIAEAAENGAKKGSAASYDPSKPLNPADFDFSTEEGRKAWEEAKAARRNNKA